MRTVLHIEIDAETKAKLAERAGENGLKLSQMARLLLMRQLKERADDGDGDHD
jgi:antitoxin component of RelBE/YafQ-DinJ toxin-antitoxin module